MLGIIPITDWLAQESISNKLIWPKVAPVIAITVVLAGNNFVADFLRPFSVMYSEGSIILKSLTFPELIHAILPPQ